MKKLDFEIGDLFVSNEVYTEFYIPESEQANEDFFKSQLNKFFVNKNLDQKTLEYIKLYGMLNNLPKPAMLWADGTTNGKWLYMDGGKMKNVQRWINENDGKYSGLLFRVCNPGKHFPKSKKSILVIPDSDVYSRYREERKDTCFDLFVPKIGEINSYTIDYELNQLKKKIGEIK